MIEVSAQRHDRLCHQLDKAVVAYESRKGPAQMLANITSVEVFESAIARQMKVNDDRHDFAQVQRRLPDAAARAVGKKVVSEFRLKAFAEIVNVAEKR